MRKRGVFEKFAEKSHQSHKKYLDTAKFLYTVEHSFLHYIRKYNISDVTYYTMAITMAMSSNDNRPKIS